MKTKYKLLTSLTALTSLSSIATTLTSCSNNTREVVIPLAYQGEVDMSFAYSDNGDGVITITPKDIHNYVPAIKRVQIGADTLLSRQTDYEYDSNTGKLTIYKDILNKYSGKIYVFPEESIFKPIVHDFANGVYTPTIAQKSGIECDTNGFNDIYLADAYNDYSIIEQDILNGQNRKLSYWSSLDKYELSIDYLKIKQTIKNTQTIYSMDIVIHNNISGTSTLKDLGKTSGQWYFYGKDIKVYPKACGLNNWLVIPFSDDTTNWQMHMYVSGFDRTEPEYNTINKNSSDLEILEFLAKYFSIDAVSDAIGLCDYNSYYFANIDTVTITSKVTSACPEHYSLEGLPSNITNKDKSLTCKIVPEDKEALYAPKLTITDSDGTILNQWYSDSVIKGDYTYTFDLSSKPINKDVKVELTLNKYLPVDYSSIPTDWSKTDTCPDNVVINNSLLTAYFNIQCKDELKDNLYLIDWQINDQDDQLIYKPAETAITTKDPDTTVSNTMKVEDVSLTAETTSLKLKINSVTLKEHAKVNYSSLPEGWAWGANCKPYIYQNGDGVWKLNDFYLVTDDSNLEEWYKIKLTVKKGEETIISQTLDKLSYKYESTHIDLSSTWEVKDISISAEFDKQVTYTVTRKNPPKGWNWVSFPVSRIYNKDGKWEISKDLDLSTREGEISEQAYYIKYIVTNTSGTVLVEKTFEKEEDQPFVYGNTISGDWGESGPGNLTLSVEITKKE